MVQVIWSRRDRDDLKEIYDYIYLNATEIAKKYVRKNCYKNSKIT